MPQVTGRTRVVGLFGWPVEHSLSPQIHNAGYKALNLDFIYVPFPVVPSELSYGMQAVRALNVAGVNVTSPHKEEVLKYLDKLTDTAAYLRAVNTIVNQGGHLVGHNTDAPGYLEALGQILSPAEIAKGSALILGGGGAARAAAAGLCLGETKRVVFAIRAPEKLSDWVKVVQETHPLVNVEVVHLGGNAFKACVRDSSIVINALPSAAADAVSADWFKGLSLATRGTLFSDLRYSPPKTPFLDMGKSRGMQVQNGLPMLLEQGLLSFALFTGHIPPREAMEMAVEL